MTLLGYREIKQALDRGDILIDSYRPEHLNPASVDLTLHDQVAVYRFAVTTHDQDPCNGVGLYDVPFGGGSGFDPKNSTHYETLTYPIDPHRGWLLKPGIGYLLSTHETVHTKNYIGVLDGKSSTGRAFIKVHETAGYIDCGFVGRITIEATVVYPTWVYPGMRLCQIRFYALPSPPEVTYDQVGQYVGDRATGPVGSRIWAQFQQPPDHPLLRTLEEHRHAHPLLEALERPDSPWKKSED